jgi:hypothetical protein
VLEGSVGEDGHELLLSAPPTGEWTAHFLTPAHHIWDDVVRTCANQRLFCSADCVDTWLKGTGQTRGYVMGLATLWRLARCWYAGRMERGCARRAPVSAASYFAEVGLHGPFWGLFRRNPRPINRTRTRGAAGACA